MQITLVKNQRVDQEINGTKRNFLNTRSKGGFGKVGQDERIERISNRIILEDFKNGADR